MPYVECERCGLTAFSAAYRFNVEYCARCGARLPRRRSAIESSRLHPPLRVDRPREIQVKAGQGNAGEGR